MLTDILKEWEYEIPVDEEAGTLSSTEDNVLAVRL